MGIFDEFIKNHEGQYEHGDGVSNEGINKVPDIKLTLPGREKIVKSIIGVLSNKVESDGGVDRASAESVLLGPWNFFELLEARMGLIQHIDCVIKETYGGVYGELNEKMKEDKVMADTLLALYILKQGDM